jgi:hypothetical protein
MTEKSTFSMTAMIVWGVMIFGIVNMAVIMLFIVGKQPPKSFPESIVYGTAVLAGIFGGIGLILPGFLRSRRACKGMNEAELFRIYLSSMIVGLALMDGISMISLVLMIVSGNMLFLGIAGFMVMLMIAHIPLPERIKAWMESAS